MSVRPSLVAVASLFLGAGAAQAFTLEVLHFNDFHSRIESINKYDSTCSGEEEAEGACFGGAARLLTAIDSRRDAAEAESRPMLVLSAGDVFQGSLFFTTYSGQAELDFMNRLGLDAMVVGNHEFDLGPGPLAEFAQGANFPVIFGNAVITEEPALAPLAIGPRVLEIGGERVGIIGAVTPETETISTPGPTVTFEQPAVSIERDVKALSDQGVNRIILLSHLGVPEDIQGLLELSKVRYVGCGVASSAVCQDKYLTKTVLGAAGIDVGEWVAFTQRDWLGDQQEWEARVAALGFPVFVKPCRAGSSLGVSRVDAAADLAAALDEAMRHDPRVIVEAACPGREVECGVLGTADGSLSASAIGEIRVLTEGFYDYESKYFAPQAVQLDCPADLPEDVARAIQKIALVAFEAVEGEGISRIDFFYNEESGRIVLNEINTLPGFTPGSLYPVMFDRVGITYPELVSALLEEAAARPVGLR